MRCSCLKCVHNTDGYCECSSYIEIDENGECDSMWIIAEKEDDEYDEKEKAADLR